MITEIGVLLLGDAVKEITILLGKNKREERVVSLQWTTRPGRLIALSFRGIFVMVLPQEVWHYKYVSLHLGRIGWMTVSTQRKKNVVEGFVNLN